MKRVIVVLIFAAVGFTVGFGVLLASSAAWAAETFHGTVHISLKTSGADICDLTASNIDESGLGNPNVTYTLAGQAVLGKACQNNGGNFPTDPKKASDAANASGNVTVEPKNGRVRGASVTIDISAQVPVPLSCPGGQTPVVVCCKYTGITLKDSTNGVAATVDTGSASFTLAGSPPSATGLCP